MPSTPSRTATRAKVLWLVRAVTESITQTYDKERVAVDAFSADKRQKPASALELDRPAASSTAPISRRGRIILATPTKTCGEIARPAPVDSKTTKGQKETDGV